jgi:hypothetical protein
LISAGLTDKMVGNKNCYTCATGYAVSSNEKSCQAVITNLEACRWLGKKDTVCEQCKYKWYSITEKNTWCSQKNSFSSRARALEGQSHAAKERRLQGVKPAKEGYTGLTKSEIFRTFTVKFNILEAMVNVTNFDTPISYVVNSKFDMSIHQKLEKMRRFMINDIEVDTDAGLYYMSDPRNATAFAIDSVITGDTERNPMDSIKIKTHMGEVSQSQPYITVTFAASNSKTQFTRAYDKIVDVFGNIGGFSDIVAFTMLVLYAWYSGLKLRLTLINKSILHFNIDYGRESDLYKNSTLANVSFSMGDLVKYFLMN